MPNPIVCTNKISSNQNKRPLGHITQLNNIACTSFEIYTYKTLLNESKTFKNCHMFQDLRLHKHNAKKKKNNDNNNNLLLNIISHSHIMIMKSKMHINSPILISLASTYQIQQNWKMDNWHEDMKIWGRLHSNSIKWRLVKVLYLQKKM